LADVNYGHRTVFDVRRGQRIARKGFRHGIEAVEELIGSDPDETRAVLEQGMNVHAAETVRILSIMMKHLARIAIKPVQAILRTEPNESLVILHDVRYSGLGKSRRTWELPKPYPSTFSHR